MSRHHRSEPRDRPAANFDFARGVTVVAVMSTDDSRDAIHPFMFDRGFMGRQGFGFHLASQSGSVLGGDHGGNQTTNTAPPIESGKMYVVTTQYSSRKAASAGTNSRRLSTAIYPTRTSSP